MLREAYPLLDVVDHNRRPKDSVSTINTEASLCSVMNELDILLIVHNILQIPPTKGLRPIDGTFPHTVSAVALSVILCSYCLIELFFTCLFLQLSSYLASRSDGRPTSRSSSTCSRQMGTQTTPGVRCSTLTSRSWPVTWTCCGWQRRRIPGTVCVCVKKYTH